MQTLETFGELFFDSFRLAANFLSRSLMRDEASQLFVRLLDRLVLSCFNQRARIDDTTTKDKGETVKHTFYMLNKIVRKFLFYFGLKISSVRTLLVVFAAAVRETHTKENY